MCFVRKIFGCFYRNKYYFLFKTGTGKLMIFTVSVPVRFPEKLKIRFREKSKLGFRFLFGS